ncbi:MAG: hypothetical protein RL266_2202 [Bacteroidota bacterium]|jgi:hypothetical protein
MFNSLRRFLIIPMICLGSLQTFAQCNGHAALCGKRYNEVAYLTTHNAFNAEEDGFNLPNQTYGLTQQLNDGVRGLMLDVYDEGGIATVYHSLAFLGTTSLESNLTEIKDFLDANPNEIVTIIFECYADFELIETAFINTETLDYTLEQDLGGEWPTLQEMIDANKRLVVLSDRNDAAPGEDWYHYVWDYAVETPFSNNSNSDFTCEFNRGDENNDLFILNHFATDPNLGVGRTDLSELANEFNFFYDRARDCEATLGKFPNFPTVDFYELGNTLEVVDSLNGIPSSVGIEEKSPANSVSVFPNPSKDVFICIWVQPTAAQISLFDHAGVLVWQTCMNETSITIDLSPYPVGIYHVQVLSGEAVSTFKLVRN